MTLRGFAHNAFDMYGVARRGPRSSGRLEQLREQHGAVEGIGAVGLDLALWQGSRALMRLREYRLSMSGVVKAGEGHESVVFHDTSTNMVTKYMTSSILMDANGRRATAERKVRDFDTVCSTKLADFVLSQEITVAPFVLAPSREVVQTVQPYVDYKPYLNPVRPNEHKVDITPSSHDHANQLSDFLDGAWDLYGAHNMLPDTNGQDNLVAVDGKLTLIDSQPIGPEYPEVQSYIRGQLAHAARVLASIR